MAKNKTVKSKVMKKKALKKVVRAKKIPTEQGKSKVGYKNPPKEQQFKPGQSGNPKGPPKHRINLWVWFCKYMEMTNAELGKLDRETLTQAQQSALKLVENIRDGKHAGSERLALSIFDREEGRAVEHLVIEDDQMLSDSECDEIRNLLLKHHVTN